MTLFDDEPPRSPAQHQVGQDLSALSLHEIDDRVELLRAEIARLEEARTRKAASMSAASAFFKTGG